MLRKAYQNVEKNGDRLAEVDPLIDWEAFKPLSSLSTITRDPLVAVHTRIPWRW